MQKPLKLVTALKPRKHVSSNVTIQEGKPQAILSVEACILCFPKALAIAWFFLLNSYLPTFICNFLQVLIKK